MPTYAYRCSACGHEWDQFQSIKAEPERTCPKCRRAKAQRQVTAGAGILTSSGASEPAVSGASGAKAAAAPAAEAAKPAGADAKGATPAAPATPAPAAEKPAASAERVNATHPAREGRGAGNLRDAIKRQRREAKRPKR